MTSQDTRRIQMNINVFLDKLVSRSGENLVCLIHTGSRVRGEPRPDSDYDFTLIVSEVDRAVLDNVRNVLLDYSKISVYILDERDLKHFPKAQFLQFIHSRKVYGECDFPKPSAEDVSMFVNTMRTNELDTLRHLLTLPHDTSRLVRRIALSLKRAYICLTYLIFRETGVLPKKRLETIDYFRKKGAHRLGISLLEILENWSIQKASVTAKPREYLHMLEEFWRTLAPR